MKLLFAGKGVIIRDERNQAWLDGKR